MTNKLLVIFILSMLDVVLTYIGIKTGYIAEGNPLLESIFHFSPELASAFVLVFIGIVLYFIYKYGERFRYIKQGIAAMLIIKVVVMAAHVGWIVQVV